MMKTQPLTGTKTSRIFLLNILFLLFVNITFGQIVVETEKIDYINLEKDYFYCKDGNGKYRILDVELEKKEGDSILHPKIKYFETQKSFKEECISFDDIATVTPDEFEQLFDRKKYIIYQKKGQERLELAKFNKDHFIIYSYDCRNYDRKWELDRWGEMQLLNYCYIKTGDKFILKLLNKDSQYIIPFNDRFVISYTKPEEQTPKEIDYKSAKRFSSKELSDIVELIGGQNFQTLLGYQIKKESNGYTLRNSLGIHVLPKEKYDSINYIHRNFLTRKDSVFVFYKPTLEPISIKKVRTVYIEDGYVYGISKNRLFNLLPNGNIIYTKEPNTWERIVELDFMRLQYDILPTTTRYFAIEKNGDFYHITNTGNFGSRIVDIWEPYIDSLFFRNDKTQWYRNPPLLNFVDTYFITKKDNKYGLAMLKDESIEHSPFSLQEVIPPVFDNIEPSDDMDDVFNYNPDKDTRMFLDKDGLTGLYPVQRDVRYLKLKVYSVFARFMLPSGKKGWLNTFTGKEFLDE